MIVLPLGLGTRLIKFPFLTITIFALTTIVSIWGFKHLASYSQELQTISSHLKASSPSEYQLLELIQKYHLLNVSNVEIKAVLLSFLIHFDVWHLLLNLFMLLVFGIYLEARLRKQDFIQIYLAGGIVGILFQLIYGSPSLIFGASACVYSLVGAFFSLFLDRRIRLFTSVLVYSRFVYVPVGIFVPVVLLLSEITGYLHSISGVNDGIAHVAHLGSFVVGCIFSLWIRRRDQLPDSYAFPIERKLHAQMNSDDDAEVKVNIANEILKYNPDNYWVMADCCVAILDLKAQGKTLSPNMLAFLQKQLAPFFAVAIRRRAVHAVERVLDRLPLSISLLDKLDRAGQRTLLILISRMLRRGKWLAALRLIDAFQLRYRSSVSSEILFTILLQVLDRVAVKYPKIVQVCRQYLAVETKSQLKQILVQRFPDIEVADAS